MEEEEVKYEKLRLDVIQKLIEERGIICKNKKDEMIKMLKLNDEGKYFPPMKETTYDKSEGGYVIGIDLTNKAHLSQVGILIFKKEAKNLHRYSSDMLYYWSKQKLI